MSGPIRRLLGPTKARLQRYMKKAKDIYSAPIDEKELDQEETIVEDVLQRIITNTNLLERCNNDWLALLKELKGDERAVEEKEYLWAAEGDDGLIELLLDSKEMASCLQARLAKVTRLQERAQARPLTSLKETSQLSERERNNCLVQMKLPKLNLPIFEGDILQWQEFWDIYSAAVHEQDIPNVTKFSYLKGSLRNSAAAAVCGISVTNDNYPVAIHVLQDRFGKKEAIIEALYSQLQHLPIAVNRFSEIKFTYEAIDRILRQLEAQGEKVDQQRILIQQILSKFPTNVIVKLEESKTLKDSWTVELVRASLKQYIAIHTNAQRYESSSMPNFKKHRRVNLEATRALTEPTELPVSAESLVANSQGAPQRSAGNRSVKKEPSMPCIFCKGIHFYDACDKFTTVADRKKQLTSQGRCFVCLKVGHTCKECPHAQSRSCHYCHKVGHHHRCICPKHFSMSSNSEANPTSVNVNSSEAGQPQISKETNTNKSSDVSHVNLSHALLASGEKVLLQTAQVTVSGTDGCKISAHVLLDSASQRTFMTEHLAKQLKLPLQQKELLSISTFGGKKPQGLDTYVVQFSMSTKDGSLITLSANVLQQITGPIQRGPLQNSDLEFLQVMSPETLADNIPRNSSSGNIDILVGSDYFWNIVGRERVVLPSGLLLLSSKLGYILTGKYSDPTDSRNHGGQITACVVTSHASDPCQDLWSLEKIGITDSPYVKEDDKALEKFNNTVSYQDGRYLVTWPWRSFKPNLPENFDVAFGRMKSLARRLQADQNLLQQYCDIIQAQQEKGIIEIVNEGQVETENMIHYLSHHPVVTPLKTTTKVRIVYDASAKVRKGVKSLNECLYRGPINLPDMCGILLRFRTYLIVVLADIEKAFLQIGIQEHERDVTRFLWFKNSNNPDKVEGNLSVYRFCRVPFGIVCSPFLLEATLKYHLRKEKSAIADMICANIYVDNLCIGVNSANEAYGVYKEAKEIFRKASMHLREWSSNSREFLSCLPEDERSTGKVLKVFGLLWNHVEDYIQIPTFHFNSKGLTVTKREVLSNVAKIYDPMGMVTPVVLFGKLFIQKLWSDKLGWDDSLPQPLLQEWEKISQILQQLSKLRIPRSVCSNVNGNLTCQIITFCDASAKSYATAVYLRVVCQDLVQVNLIFSKTRLVPVNIAKSKKSGSKQLTLPRLELLAVLIGARATNFVARELKLYVHKRIILTDSQCVLHWIRTSKPLPVFVENRLDEIRREKNIIFGYIPSKQNPADFATRGLSVFEITESNLWWHGPTWLREDESHWPSWNLPDISSAEIEQLLDQARQGPQFLYETTNLVKDNPVKQVNASVFLIDESKYSSLRKLLRVTAYCLMFLKAKIWNKCPMELQKRVAKGCPILNIFNQISVHNSVCFNDIKAAKLCWISALQRRKFTEVFSAISKGQKNGLQKQLGLKVDEFNILRCHGRFLNADMSEDAKYPKLLPRREYFTKLVIQEIHESLIHAGVSHTLSCLRQEYWIPHGRVEVRSVISRCLICRRHEGPSFSLPRMPPWPKQRVSQSIPFQFTGLDYLGPVFVKEDKGVEKMWICLFTCLAIRAIHLEWVRSLSAEHFLNCLRRFMARRGRPELIISDNAAQFKLVKTVIDKQWKEISVDERVLTYFSDKGIKWQFTTALAPWQGGFYERLVGLVKRCLRKAIGTKRLTLEQFVVVLSEVEAVLNTRPLTYVYEDFESGFTLTPAHFLSANLKTMPIMETEVDFCPSEDSATTLLNNWKKGQKQLSTFWEIWKNEYLTSLRERSSLYHKVVKGQIPAIPEKGQVVIIKEDNIPRAVWKLGIIEKVIKGADGHIRTAQVRLPSNKYVLRAINQLYPMEVPNHSDKELSSGQTINSPDDEVDSDQFIENINSRRPTRQAAIVARQRINQLQMDDPMTVLFVIV